MTVAVAQGLKLGTETPFNYTGDRRKGIVAKLAVERTIDIINELREHIDRHPSVLDKTVKGEVLDVLSQVQSLPELTQNTIGEWSSAITNYVMSGIVRQTLRSRGDLVCISLYMIS